MLPSKSLTSRGYMIEKTALTEEQIKHLEKALKTAQQESADASAIKAAIGDIKTRIDTLDLPTWASAPLAKPSSPGVPLLFLSDFHWGEVVHPSQINGVNKFNVGIEHDQDDPNCLLLDLFLRNLRPILAQKART